MNKTNIIKNIFLHPRFLNKDIKKNIENETRSQLLGKCSEDTGYIIDIHDVKIIDNYIQNSSSGITYVVSALVSVFKPRIGLSLDVYVTAIFESGFFVNSNSHKILIPTPNKQTDLKAGDKVTIVLTAINYKNNSFCCIGNLKE